MSKKSFCLTLLCLVFLPLSNSYSQPQFDTWTTYWTGHNSSSVFVEDLNGDGHLDLAVSNWGDSNVSVLINNGNGTFTSKKDYDVAYYPSSIFAYDLDEDGDIDLVTASAAYDSVVSVLKNNGDGTFLPRTDYFVGTFPGSVWVADLDGDGDADLTTCSGYGYSNPRKTVSVLKNNGDGTFTAPVKYTVGNNPQRLIASDIDSDGDQDIITVNYDAWVDTSEIISILKNNGDGTFADKIELGRDSSFQNFPISLSASDFDKDGDQDLAVAVQRSPDSSVVSVFKNDGVGNFAQRVDYIVGNYPHFVYAADLDGDGNNDLAVAVSYWQGIFGNISVLKNNGNGTFAPRIDYPTGEAPISLMAKDIDGDGSKDIISATYGFGGGASILKNKGDGTFPIRSDYAVGANPHGIVASDLDGDGDNDLAIANSLEYTISILKNNANGTFQPKVNFNTNGYPTSIFASDINGDGKRDLLTAQPNTRSFSVLTNDGNAGFDTRTDYNSSSGPNVIASSDLDGDGDRDVVAGSYNGYGFAVFNNEGGGLLGPPVGYDAGYPTYEISLSDLDRDGDPDLARAGWGVYKNNGDGTFGNALSLPAGCLVSVLISDLDGDGDADWVSLHPCSPYLNANFVSVYLNNGDASFAPKVDYYAGPRTGDPWNNRMAAGDMNGDGNSDLIIANIWARTVSILTNNGNGTFGPPVGYGVGVHPHSIAASDLDGDGDLDLAVTNDSSNTVSILINQTNTCTKLGDLNRDCFLGMTDIVMELNCVFLGLGSCPLNIVDTNCDGRLTPTDVVLLLYAVFLSTPLNCP